MVVGGVYNLNEKVMFSFNSSDNQAELREIGVSPEKSGQYSRELFYSLYSTLFCIPVYMLPMELWYSR